MKLKWVNPRECLLYLKTQGEGSYFLNLKLVNTRYGERLLMKLLFRGKRKEFYEELLSVFLSPHEAREYAMAILALVQNSNMEPLDYIRRIKRDVEALEDLLLESRMR
ncbi:MAG: hypothetical protein DRJ49_07595 [Thermoprotei archaeon]|nr:MAG: hypothetical protein DRJ49_07595 [Thermoprotei archaeon]